MNTITVDLDKERLKRLLQISVTAYLNEINRLTEYSRKEEPDSARKIFTLAQKAAKDEELLEQISSEESSQES